MDVVERARRYVAKMDGSVSGSGGHNAAFAVACALVKGFALDEGSAMAIMREEFNPRCSPPWSERELQHKVRQAAQAAGEVGHLLGGNRPGMVEGAGAQSVAAMRAMPAQAVSSRRVEIDRGRWNFRLLGDAVNEGRWLGERSPVDPREVPGAAGFISGLYTEGEKVLVFTDQRSQGDFGVISSGDWRVPGKVYQMGASKTVRAKRAALPVGGRDGVWFLSQPVDFEWRPNGGRDKAGQPTLSRRSGPNVQAWRYMVLESDELSPVEWLNKLATLPLAIAAIYTSGKRSIHALCRVDCRNHGHFLNMSRQIGPVIAQLGGDAAAISGVRLTRLPFCKRGTNLQQLLYFDPSPGIRVEPLACKRVIRKIKLEHMDA